MHKGSLFSTSSLTLVICCLFDNSHSDKWEVESHCGFDVHFPGDEGVSFHMSVGHLYAFFGKMPIQILCLFFKLDCLLFGVELYEFFVYFGYQPLVGYIICKYLLPFSRWPFCCVDRFTS